MSNPSTSRRFPTGVPWLLAFVGLVLALVTVDSLTSPGPGVAPDATPVDSRDLVFEDQADGSITVYDARDGATAGVIAPGGDGFLRGTLRALARERRLLGIGDAPPFRITLWDDGGLSLRDLSTGQRIDLRAFGASNAEAFARLLEDGAAAGGSGRP